MIAPSEVLSSLAVTALLCAILAVGAAVVVVPAALVLLGEACSARLRRPAALTRLGPPHLRRWVGHPRRRPAGAIATALLAVLAIPLLSLDSGPPSVKFLPEDDPARRSFERVAQVMGPGWPTPYSVVFVSETRPVTQKGLLADVTRFQAQLAKETRASTPSSAPARSPRRAVTSASCRRSSASRRSCSRAASATSAAWRPGSASRARAPPSCRPGCRAPPAAPGSCRPAPASCRPARASSAAASTTPGRQRPDLGRARHRPRRRAEAA